jgi:DNA helicase-2/ATP-dependent DNA helicase PcrA
MVSKNRLRKVKTLWTENPEGELLHFFTAEDEEDEARFVAKKILELCRPSSASTGLQIQPSRPFRDVAVFYRINAQSRALEDALVKNGIPYTIVGGMKFYERREIKDILAYLKLIANPSDGLSLKRIINIPSRGIGEKTIEKIEHFSREKGLSLYEGLTPSLKEDWLPPATKRRIEAFYHLTEELRKEAALLSLSQLTLTLLARTGYLQQLKEERTDEALSRVENIEELVNVIIEFEKGEEEVSLETFLDKVSLVSDVDLYEDKGNRVSLMTLHCAKGLEYPCVFITGMEDGLLPHHRRGEEIQDIEEERRLFYVGMTRARERLFLSRAERRHTFGVGHANLPSRFLDEIPSDLIRFEGKEENWKDLFSYEPSESWAPRFSYGERTRGKKAPGEEVHFVEPEWHEDHYSQESPVPSHDEIVISPEGFFHLKIGMKVRHPKFGDGRVRSVEGRDEEQKATILFQSVGSKRLKVSVAHLEILGE